MNDVDDDEPQIPEADMQAILDAEELGGTPSEARAIEAAYRAGHKRGSIDGSKAQALLLAIVRKDGRAVVQRKQLDAIARTGGARLEIKQLPSGDVLLSYLGPRAT